MYEKLLLIAGFTDSYDTWLDGYLEAEDPLSDVVLDLTECGSDIPRVISVLHNYCIGRDGDENAVAEKLRRFLYDEYKAGRITVAECINELNGFAENSGNMYSSPWSSMSYVADMADYLYECYDFVDEAKFAEALEDYLANGTDMKFGDIMRMTPPKKPFWKRLFGRK